MAKEILKNIEKPVIVLFGPTASGKTDLAVKICKEYNGEVVTADSMQVYKYMNIGTAKPDEEEMDGVPHHMIDVVSPLEDYSVARYKKEAKEVINNILKRGKIPVLAGGTGLYIDAVLKDTPFDETENDFLYREYLEGLAKEKGNEYVHNMLKAVDFKSAQEIHFNNVKRVIRALEIYKTTGVTKSEMIENQKKNTGEFTPFKFYLTLEREQLYERINLRADKMIEKGLVEEVDGLLKMGMDKGLTAMQGIGYKEIIMYLNGSIALNDAIDMIKQATRRYAKRQETWFKKEKNAVVLDRLSDNYFNILKKTVEL